MKKTISLLKTYSMHVQRVIRHVFRDIMFFLFNLNIYVHKLKQ